MTNRFRLLIVEDSEDDAILLVRLLRGNGYDVRHRRVDTRQAMEAALGEEPWDLVISDYNMPSFSISDALEALTESGLDIPFIIVSGAIGEETAVEAMKAGAHDYIMKDKLARLIPAIERELREADRRRQRRQTQQDLLKVELEKERLYEQNAILAELGRIISSSLDIDNVFENFAVVARKLIPFDRINVSLIEPDDENLVIAYASGVDIPERRKGELFRMAGTIAEQAIRGRSALIIRRNDKVDGLSALPGLEPTWRVGLVSALAAPLISNDEVIGSLQFRSFDQKVYNERHLDLAANVAMQISGAIANARLYAEQQGLKEQLLQAQKMEAVGRLAGGIAHDFNNLLTPIMSYAQMGMMKLSEEDKVHRHLAEIHKAADRAADLVSKLLSFSKKSYIEPRVVKLNELVLNIESISRRLIGEDIELVNSLDPDLGLVRIDPGQMEQVLMNLIVNSRDAISGGGTIMISTSNKRLSENYTKEFPDVAPGDYVVLAVSDNGSGISEEVQAHIFEPFYTTKVQGKGTGLGLSTCYGIIKQHQGHVDVESSPGNGTTMLVYLPLVRPQVDVKHQSGDGDALPIGNETILLAEDDSLVRDMASLILSDQGYNVLEASNGVEALQLAMQLGAKIDILLTDVVMPEMGGWELSQKLKKRYPETRIIYTSGYTDNKVLAEGVQDNSIEFIQKPYTPEVLTRRVREVLEKIPAESSMNPS